MLDWLVVRLIINARCLLVAEHAGDGLAALVNRADHFDELVALVLPLGGWLLVRLVNEGLLQQWVV